MFLNIQNLITMNVYNNLFLCMVMGMFCQKKFFDDRKQCSYEVKRDCLEFRHCTHSRSPVPSQPALILRATLRSCSHGHSWSKSTLPAACGVDLLTVQKIVQEAWSYKENVDLLFLIIWKSSK